MSSARFPDQAVSSTQIRQFWVHLIALPQDSLRRAGRGVPASSTSACHCVGRWWAAAMGDIGQLAALRRLPARQREVIVLRVFLDLDIDTTARQLGIAPGTVRAHLSRAMTALRSELAPATTSEVER
jgi:DNA-binding CsgD family transcriptional regulator